MQYKRLILSAGMLVFVAAVVVSGTGAFFSDTETSTGNTFTAGSIDLMVGNSSYVTDNNGDLVESEETSWEPGSLDNELFFNFEDLKPGDIGEDTITINVDDNDAWACFAGNIEATPENGQTEPEAEVDDTDGTNEGELQDELMFAVWADDGDNVFEEDERLLQLGGDTPFVTAQELADQGSQPLADSTYSMFSEGNEGEPLTGATDYHIGKAWCYGEMDEDPEEQGEGTPVERGTGFTCNGAEVTNASQSDGVVSSLAFHAVQSRNNDDFTCSSWEPEFDGGGDADPVQFVLVDDDEESPGLVQNNEDEPMPGAEEEDQPWIEWDTDTEGEITFTFHNPTPWLYVFDVRIDGEPGSDRSSHIGIPQTTPISDPPLAPQPFGPTYQRVVVDGSSTNTVSQTFTGSNTIEVGLREGAEQHGFIDWITFEAN